MHRHPILASAGLIPLGAAAAAAAVCCALLPSWWLRALAGLAAVAGLMLWATLLHRRARRMLVDRIGEVARALPVALPEPHGMPQAAADALPASLAVIASRAAALAKQGASAQRQCSDLRAILAVVPQPVLALDGRGTVFMANDAAGALFAQPGHDLLGRSAASVFTQADLLDLALQSIRGSTREVRVRLMVAGLPRVFDAFGTPVDLGEPQPELQPQQRDAAPALRGGLIVLRDVTGLALADQVKTDFVANASHELRTPIAAIQAAAETLELAAQHQPEMRARLIAMISGHAARLEEIVRDLLDLSRLESPQLRVTHSAIDPADLASTLHGAFEPVLASRSLALRFELAPELAAMRCDRTLLLLILKNLIDNAAKFAHQGTTVRVVGRPGPALPAPIEPGVGDRPPPPPFPAGRAVVFEVIDRGIGIPIDQQQRIFERFYQVDPARGGSPSRGSGLGLSIVKHAARTLNGRVRVKSVWKEGTTMIVELPGCLPLSGPAGSDDIESAEAGATSGPMPQPG